MDKQERRLLTTQQIAERAGVSRTAVSNWAKRHADFPQPVSGPSARPVLFDEEAVERWLDASGRQSEAPRRTVAEQVKDDLVSLGSTGVSLAGTAAAFLAVAAAARQLAKTGSSFEENHLPADAAGVVAIAAELVNGITTAPEGLRDALTHSIDGPLAQDLPDLWSEMLGLREDEFPKIAETVVELVALFAGAPKRLGYESSISSALVAATAAQAMPHATSVVDPTCGTGDTLLRVALLLGLEDGVGGIDVDPALADLARVRLWLHGIRATIQTGDALGHETTGMAGAQLVVAEPPSGHRLKGVTSGERARRVFPLAKGPFAQDAAMVADCAERLTTDGKGVLLVPTAMMASTSLADWRQWMMSEGVLATVVELPKSLPGSASVGLTLLEIRAKGNATAASVDLIDLSKMDVKGIRADGIVVAIEKSKSTAAQTTGGCVGGRVRVAFDQLGEGAVLQPSLRLATSMTGEEALEETEAAGERLEAALDELGGSIEDHRGLSAPRFMYATAQRRRTVAELIEDGIIRVVRAQATEPAEDKGDSTVLVFPTEGDDVEKTGKIAKLRHVVPGPGFEPLEAGDVVLPLGGKQPVLLVDQLLVDLRMTALGSGARALRVVDRGLLDPAYLKAVLGSSLNRLSATTGGMMRRPYKDMTVAFIEPTGQQAFVDELGELEEVMGQAHRVRKAAEQRLTALLNWASVR